MTIIQLHPTDWQKYKDLRLEALKTSPDAFGSTYEMTLQKPDSYWQDRLQNALEGTHAWMFFAEEEGELVGMIGAFMEDQTDSAEIVAMFVKKSHRNKGIARELILRMINELDVKKGLKTVTLSVRTDQDPAIGLYKKMGFTITITQQDESDTGLFYDEYIMTRSLA